MRRSLWIVAAVAIAVVMSSCSAMFNASSYGSNDLYNTNNRVQVANRLKAEAEAEAAEAAARQAQWEARTAQANAEAAEAEYYAAISESPDYINIVADDYDSAYARRLYGFNSPTYNYPSSYYSLLYSDAMRYASAYDPAYYNIMVSGNQVWVEPRYVTSMFGAWGATNVTYGIYSSPWNYGWCINVDPFYYSWWGYPRYSWYDWNWNVCYNRYHYYYDWWGYPYYYGYHHHHHHYGPGHHYNPPRPPQHRPNHDGPGYRPNNRPNHGLTTGTGASAGRPIANLNGNRDNTGSRYTSPTTNRNYGKVETTIGSGRPARGGSVSTGVNSNSNYRVSGTKIGVSTTTGGVSTTVRDGGTRNNNSSVTTTINAGRSNNYRQGGTSSRSSSSSSSGTVSSSGGSTSSKRSSGSSSSSSSYRSSSSSSSSSYRSSGSSSSSYRSSGSSSSSYRSSGSSSRSSSSSSSSSRSGGGSTSSRR